jgi:hypothetical protein
MNEKTTRRARGLAILGLSAAFAVGLAACSGGSGTSSTPGGGTVTTAPPSAAATQAAAPASSPAGAGSLTGSWSGQYSGNFSGTFSLTWTESGSKLHGTIHISNPDQTMPINGTVSGGSIQFGTVGSTAITYSGSVSGSSMSGTYQVGGSPGGPWSASQS